VNKEEINSMENILTLQFKNAFLYEIRVRKSLVVKENCYSSGESTGFRFLHASSCVLID
jgi:hypothetical protein